MPKARSGRSDWSPELWPEVEGRCGSTYGQKYLGHNSRLWRCVLRTGADPLPATPDQRQIRQLDLPSLDLSEFSIEAGGESLEQAPVLRQGFGWQWRESPFRSSDGPEALRARSPEPSR